jgi:hypothetical protein
MPGASFGLLNKANLIQANSGYFILDKITSVAPKFTNPPYGKPWEGMEEREMEEGGRGREREREGRGRQGT